MPLLLLLMLQAVSLRNNKFSGSADQFGSCTLVSLDLAVSQLAYTFAQVLPVLLVFLCLLGSSSGMQGACLGLTAVIPIAFPEGEARC
jgi:hypothetical protein